jgi:ribosomal protein S18 acetylase RimI-like enzyme
MNVLKSRIGPKKIYYFFKYFFYLLRQEQRLFLHLTGKKMLSKNLFAKGIEIFRLICNKESFKLMELDCSGKVTCLFLAHIICPFGTEKFLSIKYFYISPENTTKDSVLKYLNIARGFFSDRVRLRISVFCLDKKLKQSLLDLNFTILGTRLVANIEDCLKSFDHQKFSDNEFYFEYFNFSKDQVDFLELELRVHQQDPSSLLYGIESLEQFGHFSKTLKRLEKLKTVVLLKRKGKMIGSIAMHPGREGLGHVSSISVDLEFQGQGLSKLLYQEGLKRIQQLGCTHFIGVSATERVLSQAHLMKRSVYAEIFVSES